MKVFGIMILLFCCSLPLQTASASSDWMQLKLKNGSLVNGHVVNVTDESVHLVGASINRIITFEQLEPASKKQVLQSYPAISAIPEAQTLRSEQLKSKLRVQRNLRYTVAETYTPYSTYPHSYTSSYSYSPYRYRYTPRLASYRCNSSYFARPRPPLFSIQIDL
jgi:hypothetical protein